MKSKYQNKLIVIGFFGPSILAFVLLHLFNYVDIRIFEYLTVNILNQYTIGMNIANYSAYPEYFSAALLVNIASIPILIFHWWFVVDAKNPKGMFHVLSPIKGVLFLLIVPLLPIALWSFPIEPDDLEYVGRNSLVNIYTSSFFFYLMVLLPICFWSASIAGFVKTQIKLKK
ncbi:hypothetical protein [Psychromonas sp. Urea-02u-13]|uniref:hypothetical protein n=1 Tax=Psychromonas sp. Urea-02u-13 TaxID=2058326 RepID=UPI000C32CB13|nr:hypothetical protein [Psychromonas sp. Urea-02u-13]PKG36979.1 hypothetical protein CXF74_21320 [Psychromonas sp. Urea-02u-13]